MNEHTLPYLSPHHEPGELLDRAKRTPPEKRLLRLPGNTNICLSTRCLLTMATVMHSDLPAAPLDSDRTPRPRTIGVPGVAYRDPRRQDVVCPGYAGHCPGEQHRFGRSASFHRPDHGGAHERTPRGQRQSPTRPFPHHREGSDAAQSVRLSRPTTAWQEVGEAARRQMMTRSASSVSATLSARGGASPRAPSSSEGERPLWTPRSPFKEVVGGVTSGYSGFMPGARFHFGTPTTGLRGHAGQHQSIHEPHLQRPLEQRDRTPGGALSDPPRLRPTTQRLTSVTTVGYRGHVPDSREAHGRAAWRSRSDYDATGLGWKPNSTPSSQQRVSRTDAQAARAARSAHEMEAAVSAARGTYIHGRSRRSPNPSANEWGGVSHVDYGAHVLPAAGKHIAWPHRGFGAYGTSDAVTDRELRA